VKIDDLVEQGQVVLILEAMKMQNEIQAPLSGKIIEINCESGDSIEANMPLIVIEPENIGKD
jgi:biotin carboxyl carrier protein